MANSNRKTGKLKGLKRNIITVIALLLLTGGVYLALTRSNASPPTENIGSGAIKEDESVNLAPATEKERQEAERHKENLANEPAPSPTTTTGKKQVTPIITNADVNEVNAYVTGIFEEGGTCTATLTKGSKKVTRSSTGFQNASYTSCAPIDVSGSLEPGTWTVVVTYTSASSEGKSMPREFNV